VRSRCICQSLAKYSVCEDLTLAGARTARTLIQTGGWMDGCARARLLGRMLTCTRI
jgi:hypothetical protein